MKINKYLIRYTYKLLSISLLVCSQNIWAIEPANANQEIIINADHMQLNVETGHSIFTGNVEISQGDLTLSGEKVTLKRKQLKNGESEIDKLTIIGNPARYDHINKIGKTIKAESKKMVYSATIGKLVMTINASLSQPENQVSSQKIVYDTFKKVVIAGAEKPTSNNAENNSSTNKIEPNQRVKITLTPRKK